ncbi:cation:proton antiporter domain-containing protein [Membranihabitans maritimus]|uniref:cation:proton antiporter domain-containing protein n=1 Tax=Membranihabitans maritimus TaxID=2904244 RepID=UPI001F026F35|nr:cation:proton antiporter [Membranihabitans maritimus]
MIATIFALAGGIDLSNPYVLLICASIILVLSYFFNKLSEKTNIPSVLLLIITGILIKFGVEQAHYDMPNLMPYLEILGIVGLIMIVLEAALDLELNPEKYPLIGNSLLIAFLCLIATTFAVAYFLYAQLDLTFGIAFLYATPLTIMSSAIIIPSVTGLVLEKKEFMIYESAFSDILGILLFYFVISFLEEGGVKATSQFFISLIMTILVALIASIILIYLFKDLKSQTKLFLLTANLILLYSLGKLFHLSPLIIILVFGLALSNHGKFKNILNKYGIETSSIEKIEKEFHLITLETAFLVRTFFFVVFGMTIDIQNLLNLEVFLISLAVVSCIFIFRSVMLYFFARSNFYPEVYIAPRGLVTILLFFQIPEQFISSEVKPGIVLYVIIITSLVMTYYLIKDKMNRNQQTDKEDNTSEEIDAAEKDTSLKTV